ncbi:MAG: hypothetical protein AB1758_25725, partial [Candidatus Eremiobacterota bacterium]
GTDARRGVPYTWLPNHLGDALEQVSPRSFLQAVRGAALETEDRYPDSRHALHFEAIKAGVQRASQIRVEEIQEDYPWVRQAMEPLRGLLIPCDPSDLLSAWESFGLIDRLQRARDADPWTPQPMWLEVGLQGLLADLERLGLLARMLNGRYNMPDVYRVGFGLLRRGGVKPVR